MKSFYLSGILLLTFIGGIVFSTPSSAISTPVSASQTVTRPTKLEIEQAILKVRGIGDYERYFPPATNSPALDSSVKFYQEYNYLHALVATASQLLASYDTASTDDLFMIIAAAQDAEIACNLKFGITRQQAAAKAEAEAQSKTQSQTPTTPATAAPQDPTASTTTTAASTTPAKAKSTQSTTSPTPQAVAKSQPTQSADPQAVTDIPAGSVPTPANSNLSATTATDLQSASDNSPRAELLAHGSTATVATCFIGAVVYNERRTYRPGRSRK